MLRHLFLFIYTVLVPTLAVAQVQITGTIVDNNTNTPLPFATIKTTNQSYALASATGEFVIRCKKHPIQLHVSYVGYHTKTFTIQSEDVVKVEVRLTAKEESLESVQLNTDTNLASDIIIKAIAKKNSNNPNKALPNYSYKAYNKFKITQDRKPTLETPDTTKVAIEQIFNKSHSFLSEKISQFRFKKGRDEKETVLATRMSGFHEPVYNVLGIKVQSNSLYEEDYVIFDNIYAAPLSNRALKNYHYKVLDTTKGSRPAYVILFQPKKSKKVASLEGVLYLDTKTFAIQKAIAEVRGEFNIMVAHDFTRDSTNNIWFPSHQEISIRPGLGKQKISLFGGQISVGRLSNDQKSYAGNNDFLVSKTDFFDFETSTDIRITPQQAAIEIHSDATQRDSTYWNIYRTSAITKKDINSFPIIDSIVKAQNIERKIDVIQGFNIGYYPVSFFDFDLTYPIKFNNFEGLRLGIGGITNEKLSKRLRLEGYIVYGFKDQRFKYGLGGGVLLNKKKGAWLNLNYTDDLREVGSFTYLTDRRVYSLFEPRLVNIDFYYKHRTWSSSLQYRIFPKLLSEFQFATSTINQTGGYAFIHNNTPLSTYKTTEASIALRWSPFSRYLRTPNGFKEIQDGYPKVSAQYTQGIQGIFDSDFSYKKFGIKATYTLQRLNQSKTSFLLEANLANGDIPLTHLYHTYPNAPTKETVLQRFSVAGRRSFETMFFSEFFSDRLATLQVRHQIRPFKISNWLKPELVLISRYAIGDVSERERHIGTNFRDLSQGYQESGFEINKLFAGFGVSFAYRYGAYHLPRFEDNIAFKFTFYLKL